MVLSLKDKVLLSVSPLFSFFDPSKRVLPLPVWVVPDCFPALSSKIVLNTLFKVEALGLVAKSFLGETKYVSLANKGILSLLSNVRQLSHLQEVWDGNMRLIFFDIPENDRKLRDELRFGLLEMGFISWQKSVYITPYSVEAELVLLTRKLGVEKFVNMMLISKVLNKDISGLVWELWKLRGINERYNIFISQAKGLLEERVKSYKKWIERCQKLRFDYYEILSQEPFLPSMLTGSGYSLNEASQIFNRLGEELVKILERV